MRVVFCFLLLFIGAVYSSLDEEFDPADNPNFTGCPCLDQDLECIREYFTKHSQCKKAQGPVANPLFVKKYSIDIANSNITADVYDAKFEGLDQLKIIDNYFNIDTQKFVLTVETPSVKIDSKKLVFKYNRKGREPLERTNSIICDYGPLTFTIVFPFYQNLSLKDADVFTFIHNAIPEYTIGRSINLDSATKPQYDKMIENVGITLQELFAKQGRILMINYIQQVICNFGVELNTE